MAGVEVEEGLWIGRLFVQLGIQNSGVEESMALVHFKVQEGDCFL